MSKEKKETKKRVKCRFCGNGRAVIKKYGLKLCRRCFKDYAERLGWEKFS